MNPVNMPEIWCKVSARKKAQTALAGITESDDPAAIVRALAPQDLLFVWHQADDDQRASLLALAERQQVVLLADLTCWKGDQLDLDAICELVRPLTQAGVEGSWRAIDLLEDELRTLLLKRHAVFHVLEDINETIDVPDTSELLACPDGRYYVEFPGPDQVPDAERAVITALLYREPAAYIPELEAARHEFTSELEETALRWRNARLADFGFAPHSEAVGLLAPRSAEEARRLAKERLEHKVPRLRETELPVLYREFLPGNDFLDRAVAGLAAGPDGAERLSGFAAELTAMTSLFLSAVNIDLGDTEAITRAVTTARNLLALVLHETARGGVESASELLDACPPAVFLQVGLGMAYPLQRRAQALLREKRLVSPGHEPAAFDPPHFVTLQGLAAQIPLFCPDADSDDARKVELYRVAPPRLVAFSSSLELDRAERLLAEAEQVPKLLFDILGCEAPLVAETPASAFVLTALASAAQGGDLTGRVVQADQAIAFRDRVLEVPEKEFLGQAIAVLAPAASCAAQGTLCPGEERDPMRRLMLRLVVIGRARLAADLPARVLLVEP